MESLVAAHGVASRRVRASGPRGPLVRSNQTLDPSSNTSSSALTARAVDDAASTALSRARARLLREALEEERERPRRRDSRRPSPHREVVNAITIRSRASFPRLARAPEQKQ